MPSSKQASSSTTSTKSTRRRDRLESRLDSATPHNILLFLVAFRILNALCVKTFFQPDEFFQSLEPAWQIVFGKDSGAWITWEWRHHLRSSLHPYIFAVVYYVSNIIARWLSLSPLSHADLLVAAPKVTQAVFAAIGDYYTWKMAVNVYGNNALEPWTALALTVLSPWQWFCSTRTLSNCLETTLTIVALYLWPWQWPSELTGSQRMNGSQRKSNLRSCLLLAALACVLRPTNLIIWLSLATFSLISSSALSRADAKKSSFLRGTKSEWVDLASQAILCGSAVLCFSVMMDRLYYGTWTFPPFKFLYFNIAQSLAVFYGKNDWHYYLSQGYPLLLTTALPFALVGVTQALFSRSNKQTDSRDSIKRLLAFICIFMPFVLSFISHKEVRFIYPLLPSLHVLSAPPLTTYFRPVLSSRSPQRTPRKLLLAFLLLANVVIGYYTSLSHMSGPLNVLDYLRQQHDRRYIDHSAHASTSFSYQALADLSGNIMTVGFLMPCHSTPWRSHLAFPSIYAWALSCEPPVNLSTSEKENYLDEADQFYADPAAFLRRNMVGGLKSFPRKLTYQTGYTPHANIATDSNKLYVPPHHNWPDYLVFFEQLEPTLQSLLRSSSYAECYRTWNTAWHDDWRRKGDMIVWCIDPSVQQDWASQKRAHQEATWRKAVSDREKQFDRIVEGLKRDAKSGWESRTKAWTWKIPSLSNRRPGWFSWPSSSWEIRWGGRRWRWQWSWPWNRQKKTFWPTWMTPPSWENIRGKRWKASKSLRDLWS